MPSLVDIFLEVQNINEKLDALPTIIEINGNQVIVSGLDEISESFGLFRVGEFRAGNNNVPGDSFSGIRICYPPMAYPATSTISSDLYNLVGVDGDTLMVGIGASDGTLYWGGGAGWLDVLGIGITEGEATANSIRWVDDSGGTIARIYGTAITSFIQSTESSDDGQSTLVLRALAAVSTDYSNALMEARLTGDTFRASLLVSTRTLAAWAIDGWGGATGNALAVVNDETVINARGGDYNTRIQSDTNTNMLVVDAGAASVAIGGVIDDEFMFKVHGPTAIVHTATTADEHAIEIDADAAGKGDVKAVDIDYITGNISAGKDDAVVLINIDETAATGGDVFAVEVLATDGSAGIYGLKTGVQIGPIHQDAGTFEDPTTATDNTAGSSVTDTTIGFTQTPDTITDSNNGFGSFVAGEIIVVTGATTGANNTTYTITAATAGALTVTPQPNTVESDGATITVKGKVPAMIDGDTGTTTAIFDADDEYIIIGAATAFQEMELILTTQSNKNIKPTFWYSTAGTGQFTQFTPVDGTDGCLHTGVIAWDASDLTSHVADDATGTFDIKIIRTRNVVATPPVLGYAKTASTTEFIWNKDGDVNINDLSLTGTIKIQEQADADGDTPAYGQIWVNTASPNQLFFTDDGGADHQLGVGGGYDEGARVYNDANISTADGSLHTLTFNQERYDTDTIHSTSSNPSRLTCKTAGIYAIVGSVAFAANGVGRRLALIKFNGGSFIGIQQKEATAGNVADQMTVSAQYEFAVDDYVELQSFQQSGGARDVTSISAYSPEFMMHKIGAPS